MLRDLARRTAFSDVTYVAGRRMRPHAHATTSISLVLSGRVDEGAVGAWSSGRALAVLVKPGGVVHENRFGERGARLFSLVLPRRAGAFAYGSYDGGDVTRHALVVLRAHRDGGRPSPDSIVGLLEAVGSSPRPATPEPWLVEARTAMARGEAVEATARRLRVHPGSLARAYRRAYGLTPTADRARARVRRAAERIGASGDDLAIVAADVGFADQAHLTRTFKRETGTTPAAYRALVTA